MTIALKGQHTMQLLADFFQGLDRLGPGSTEATLKALSFVTHRDNTRLKIADIGCGTGAQTLVLAEAANCEVTAVDIFPDFLDALADKASRKGVQEQIRALQASMSELPFRDGEFDIIWSEASVYNVGFREGIDRWRRFIRTGGYLVVSDVSWMLDSRPEEVEMYWKNEYPGIEPVSGRIAVLEQCGYMPVAHFALSDDCWLDNYYIPVQQESSSFIARHRNSPESVALVSELQRETEVFEKYGRYYNYVFYIARRS